MSQPMVFSDILDAAEQLDVDAQTELVAILESSPCRARPRSVSRRRLHRRGASLPPVNAERQRRRS